MARVAAQPASRAPRVGWRGRREPRGGRLLQGTTDLARCYGSRLELAVIQTPAAPGQFTQTHCARLVRALRLRQWTPK